MAVCSCFPNGWTEAYGSWRRVSHQYCHSQLRGRTRCLGESCSFYALVTESESLRSFIFSYYPVRKLGQPVNRMPEFWFLNQLSGHRSVTACHASSSKVTTPIHTSTLLGPYNHVFTWYKVFLVLINRSPIFPPIVVLSNWRTYVQISTTHVLLFSYLHDITSTIVYFFLSFLLLPIYN